MQRKEPLITGEIYHVFDKSIANFVIFNNIDNFLRMKNTFMYYQAKDMHISFAQFLQLKGITNDEFFKLFRSLFQGRKEIIQIIAYCIMPTHLHIILKQLEENGISTFMGNVLNSYSRYFNTKYKRNGPLWQNRFQNVRIKSDKQLIHLTRYIHLNPVTNYLVNDPQDYQWSSYKEYAPVINDEQKICEYSNILSIERKEYEIFTKDGISYQRELKKIADLLLE